MLELIFSKAEPADAEQLAELINSAYRGESSRQGWTTEADLLDGRRTDAVDILDLITGAESMILLCRRQGDLLGSVHLQKVDQQVHIGMLAVAPAMQGLGIGKRLLEAAEAEARQAWLAACLVMAVIPARTELIAFYERRGYQRTGVIKAFPVNPALWKPKVAGLSLELLEKQV
ncbi:MULTISPECIES: GNAT family N-acetyltransferase [Methylomonas]|uniref:GCN5 family acetyltransferase n=2 Tax=Methylomonas TaxID=416 RepID=A0A126T4L6_9GAMM|nr:MULTISPECIES: N-acetyltransferase [Methylomonas]AMK77000.1 GCN5 family acetyltransferase [Methylomonas denitrificans]OAH98028.1 GCN5 family acetyltransferase [Methylomonas methanica]TCV81180.1 ribosomal protein S18 acetylase RimI-like enzyme [Methylomonas methanica]